MTLSERRVARALALQALYELDCTSHSVEQVVPERLRENQISDDQRTFIYGMVNGVRDHLSELDALIAAHATERPSEQITPIDHNILRMAIYDFAIARQTPVSAAINEAVELAKTFGAESAFRFVNGVLGALADQFAADDGNGRVQEESN
ncbi:MAG: transcription antitermination factor NusB [Aggregatilineales bacterium]